MKGHNMKTNDLKKGTEIILEDDTRGTMNDNKKGNIRQMNLDNIFGGRNLGDQYTWKIVAYVDAEGQAHGNIEYTPSQLKCRDAVNALDAMF
jgi:hypothetical protein